MSRRVPDAVFFHGEVDVTVWAVMHSAPEKQQTERQSFVVVRNSSRVD